MPGLFVFANLRTGDENPKTMELGKMKKISLFVLAIAVTALFLGTTGCQRTKGRWNWADNAPPPELRTAPGGDMSGPTGADVPLTGMEWQPVGMAPPPIKDGIVPVENKRWEGVAVYFSYDRSTIGTSERAKVEALAKYLLENIQYHVIVEGHCDERGSDEYNRALGERRALAVKDYLVNLGVGGDRIETVSYGEEKPAVPDATTDSQHAKNRRAEFVIGIRR
jgi:peptidoglycan-associated lipoprotein